MKLFPLLAGCFLHAAGTDYISMMYDKLIDGIEKKDFQLLQFMHHLSAGMKSVYTQDCVDGILQARQAIGGGGYSAWSAIPSMLDDTSPAVTFEGDNTVMAQ